ncbi:MAG TPA: hypothetical protein DDX54_07420 [Rhodospirillaceae bacterium]|nr:hypothetical protein [Rhodospirillaceae bacterium]
MSGHPEFGRHGAPPFLVFKYTVRCLFGLCVKIPINPSDFWYINLLANKASHHKHNPNLGTRFGVSSIVSLVI